MTKSRAIEILKTPTEHIKIYEDDFVFDFEFAKAYEMAVKNLEEIQAYQSIGTVKGYESAMESSIENYNLMREYKLKTQQFEAIGTVEELQVMKNVLNHLLTNYLHQTIRLYSQEESAEDLEPILSSLGISANVLDQYEL